MWRTNQKAGWPKDASNRQRKPSSAQASGRGAVHKKHSGHPPPQPRTPPPPPPPPPTPNPPPQNPNHQPHPPPTPPTPPKKKRGDRGTLAGHTTTGNFRRNKKSWFGSGKKRKAGTAKVGCSLTKRRIGKHSNWRIKSGVGLWGDVRQSTYSAPGRLRKRGY